MRPLAARSALAAATAGVLMALAACSGTNHQPSSGQSTTPLPPLPALPAGYQRVTSTAQHLSVAVPANWVALDLSKLSTSAALRRFSVGALPSKFLISDIETLGKRHALFLADLGSVARSPHKFATNANAFCNATALLPGAGAASQLDTEFRAEWANIHVTLVSLRNTTVNSHEVVLTMELRARTSAGYLLTELQVDELTAQGQLCYLTMTTDRPTVYLPTFRTIAATMDISG